MGVFITTTFATGVAGATLGFALGGLGGCVIGCLPMGGQSGNACAGMFYGMEQQSRVSAHSLYPSCI